MQNQFEKYCSLAFKEVRNEISDDEFKNVQRIIGMWPLPKDWKTPEAKSGYLMFPDRGLCIIEAPFAGYGSFKISISIKMGEVRLGFIFPSSFASLIDSCSGEIEQFILREYTSNEGRNQKTLTNFSTTPSGEKIIDFIFYDQFADLDAMVHAINKNESVAISLARSLAMTLSHLYCNIVSYLLVEDQVPQDGIVEDEVSETIASQRIYILIDPNQGLSKEVIAQKVEELDGRFITFYEMHEDSKIMVISWPTVNLESLTVAEKELRAFAYRNESEIHLYEQFHESIEAIPVETE